MTVNHTAYILFFCIYKIFQHYRYQNTSECCTPALYEVNSLKRLPSLSELTP